MTDDKVSDWKMESYLNSVTIPHHFGAKHLLKQILQNSRVKRRILQNVRIFWIYWSVVDSSWEKLTKSKSITFISHDQCYSHARRYQRGFEEKKALQLKLTNYYSYNQHGTGRKTTQCHDHTWLALSLKLAFSWTEGGLGKPIILPIVPF